ncbi:MAG: peroxiredoxin-like family protein [Magnetovibrio sp.]|nr:peroxiredoxin-like family protein [Magnetovibrio sp.]
MSTLTPLFPRQPVPALEVATLGGGTWKLSEQAPENFTMVVFFRGLHCPICAGYLRDLQRKLGDFADAGVGVIAVSPDSEDRAAKSKEEWGLDDLTLGYGLDLDTARAWGLYVSTGRGPTSSGVEETRLFSEPGLFMVRPDGTLYFGSVQTMPFARPNFAEVLTAAKFVVEKDYPARGQVVDHTNPEGSPVDWPTPDYDPA